MPVTWYVDVATVSWECWAITWTLTWYKTRRIIIRSFVSGQTLDTRSGCLTCNVWLFTQKKIIFWSVKITHKLTISHGIQSATEWPHVTSLINFTVGWDFKQLWSPASKCLKDHSVSHWLASVLNSAHYFVFQITNKIFQQNRHMWCNVFKCCYRPVWSSAFLSTLLLEGQGFPSARNNMPTEERIQAKTWDICTILRQP